MKKKILLLFLVLALALTAAGAAVSACAENIPEETRQSEPAPEPQEDHTENAPTPVRPVPRSDGHRAAVSVTGSGKVTVPADAAQLSFRIRVLSDSFSEGEKALLSKLR